MIGYTKDSWIAHLHNADLAQMNAGKTKFQ
jgi:hypothetical protein